MLVGIITSGNDKLSEVKKLRRNNKNDNFWYWNDTKTYYSEEKGINGEGNLSQTYAASGFSHLGLDS